VEDRGEEGGKGKEGWEGKGGEGGEGDGSMHPFDFRKSAPMVMDNGLCCGTFISCQSAATSEIVKSKGKSQVLAIALLT